MVGRRYFSLILVLGLLLLLVAVGCDETKNSDMKSDHVQTLLNDINLEGKYGLIDYPWLISSQDVLEQLPSEPVEMSADRIMIVGSLDLPAEIDQKVMYGFQDDQFVYISYLFVSSDEQAYMNLASTFQASLSDVMGEPITTEPNLQMFDRPIESANSGSKLTWIGEDNSYLEVLLTTTEQEDTYLLNMSVSSPRPQSPSFKPTDG